MTEKEDVCPVCDTDLTTEGYTIGCPGCEDHEHV